METFDIHVTVYRDKFLIIKPTRWTNFSNLLSSILALLASFQKTCMTCTIAVGTVKNS